MVRNSANLRGRAAASPQATADPFEKCPRRQNLRRGRLRFCHGWPWAPESPLCAFVAWELVRGRRSDAAGCGVAMARSNRWQQIPTRAALHARTWSEMAGAPHRKARAIDDRRPGV